MIYKQVSYYVYKSFYLCKTNVIVWDQVVIVSNMFIHIIYIIVNLLNNLKFIQNLNLKKKRLLMICLNS
jgi:hypothetical protein